MDDPRYDRITLVSVGQEGVLLEAHAPQPLRRAHLPRIDERKRMLRIDLERSEDLWAQNRAIDGLCRGRRWRADCVGVRCSSVGGGDADDAGDGRDGLVTVGDAACRCVGKKAVGSEVGDGGSKGSGQNGFLGAGVDSEKVLGEGNVVCGAGGRHGARYCVLTCCWWWCWWWCWCWCWMVG